MSMAYRSPFSHSYCIIQSILRYSKSRSFAYFRYQHANCSSTPFSSNALELQEFTDGNSQVPCGLPTQSVDRLMTAKAEYEALKLDGENVPSHMSLKQWETLLDLPSIRQKKRYLNGLYKKDMRKIKRSECNKIKHTESTQKLHGRSNGKYHTEYGLDGNSIMNKVRRNRINAFYHGRLFQARLHDQPIVFDFDFNARMTTHERNHAALQFRQGFKFNREHSQPFYIHICNYKEKCASLVQQMPTLHSDTFPVDIHEDSYLSVFDKHRLVYLTPDASSSLEEYDPNAVYIIGYLVDLGRNLSLTAAKAESEGISTKKLPLDKSLSHYCSDHRLPINQVLGALLEMKNRGCWSTSLRKFVSRHRYRDIRDLNSTS